MYSRASTVSTTISAIVSPMVILAAVAQPSRCLRSYSFDAMALGTTFILGSYSAASTSLASLVMVARSSARHDSHGP